MRARRPLDGPLFGLLGAGLLTAILLPVRSAISLETATLIYLLFAVLVAALAGLWAGLVASFAVILALDFVFVPPVFGLTLEKSADMAGLAVFLIVAATSSVLVARSGGRIRAAVLRQRESELLYELATLVISDLDSAGSLETICARVREAFGADRVAVLTLAGGDIDVQARDAEDVPLVLDDVSLVRARELLGCESRTGSDASGRFNVVASMSRSASDVVLAPMMVSDSTVGVLYVSGAIALSGRDPAPARLLNAFCQVAALAVHHSRLVREATETRALREADGLKSALLATVSHELRTPLGSIKAAVTALLDPGDPWEERESREFLLAIDQSTDRLSAFVDNLLALSRIEGGALRQTRDWYDLQEFLRTVIDRVEPSLPGHPITLQVSAAAGEGYFDYVQLAQVVGNLIENAGKFSADGAPIRVEAAGAADAISIAVIDEGIGIAPEDLPHIFDRFYRGRRAAELATGTGLGLTISKGIVEAHGGSLAAEAAPSGVGSKFTVMLPVPSVVPLAQRTLSA
jgi:two-component system sensor histidine kinase KdpD